MQNLMPWDTLLLLLIVNLAILVGFSMFLGLLVARVAGATAVKGLVVGLVLLVGPLVWFLRVLRTDGSLLRVSRATSREAVLLGAAGALLLAAALLVAGMFLPWVKAEGQALTYSLSFDGAAADTTLGVVAVLMTAGVLVLAAATALFSTARGRAAALVAFAGALWLMVSLDAWIVVAAASDVASTAETTSEGGASASVKLGGALRLTLAAVTTMFVTAVLLATHRDRDLPSVAAATGGSHQVPAASTAATPSTNYGDGF